MSNVIQIKRNRVPETNLVIIDETWFSPGANQQPIGVVLVEDVYLHTLKCYMGTGVDRNEIVRWGAKVSRKMAESLFGPLPEWYTR